jgi:hypothetical protein
LIFSGLNSSKPLSIKKHTTLHSFEHVFRKMRFRYVLWIAIPLFLHLFFDFFH